MNTLVSVVIPTYNGAMYLRSSLLSILRQTHRELEIIVVNDGSTDETEEILASFSDPRIRVIRNSKNLGIVRSLNTGVNLASGDFIARMDSDDIAHPRRIEYQIRHFKMKPHLGVLGTCFEFLEHNTLVEFPKSHNHIKSRLFYFNSIGHPTAMINRRVVGSDFVYSDGFKHAEDYELWARLSHQYYLENLPDNLLKYRIHSDQISSSFKKSQDEVVNVIRINNANRLGILLTDTVLLDQIFNDSLVLTDDAEELAQELIIANNQKKIFPTEEFQFFVQMSLRRSGRLSVFKPKSYLKHYAKGILKRVIR